MSIFRCPYCSTAIPITPYTVQQRFPSFDSNVGHVKHLGEVKTDPSCLSITFYQCPECKQFSIIAEGIGTDVRDVYLNIRPLSSAKSFPDYIPAPILEDYREACSIIHLSPKASATLSRRCLQGMIRDFWKINEPNLSKAIEKLNGKVPAGQWKVIDSLRRIGNIGAHMEKDINLIIDIDPDEAQKLIQLIEHLLQQWYINRYEQEQLYEAIIHIDSTKQSIRKGE